MKGLAVFLIVLIALFVIATALRAAETSESSGAGMDWLVFEFALECGLLPNTGFAIYQPDLKSVAGADGFYTALSASVESFGFYVGGGMRNYFWKMLEKGFRPYQMTFRFDAGWRNDFLDIGFRHYCMHPVVPFLGLTGAPPQNWECAYEVLFFRIHGRLPLIKGKER